MKIKVKCFATLAKFGPQNDEPLEVTKDITVSELMKQINLKKEDVKIVFVNGVIVKLSKVLKEGDRVGFFPAVGGG